MVGRPNMKLLLNCDQVFDVLTRGPFPTGEPTDEAVEQHLEACHECRQLAEALRPAVALLHEAVSKEDSLELPEYLGALPEPDPFENDLSRPLLQGMRLLDRRPPASLMPTAGALGVAGPRWGVAQLLNAARLMAASLLVVALGWLAWGLALAPRQPGFTADVESPPGAVRVRLDERGLLTLAALKLPQSCIPRQLELTDPGASGTLLAALADAVQCCSACHHRDGLASNIPVAGTAQFMQACVACHHG
jgi:hypothetical protein